MKITAIFLILAAIISANVNAQVYKCNNNGTTVFSDIPCAPSAQKIRTTPSSTTTVPSEDPVSAGEKLCRSVTPKTISLKDPESAKIEMVTGGKMKVITYANKPTAARLYIVYINAKNSYGAYTGEKPFPCHTSEDGKRILLTDQ